jgi:ABC-2 type transport system ATP-binding protein
MDAVIHAEQVTVRFGSFTAVNEVSLDVFKGELFGFLGPNGSGKTTFIKALCGLLPISSGNASILGIDVKREAAKIKRHVGYMSQKFGLYEDLTVSENLDFYSGVYGLRGAELVKRKNWVIELTSLGPYTNRRSGALSGGWKQRLALACAIIHSPQVVFLDEPTAGIDPVARRALWDLLFSLSAEGVTFFVTTHYMDEAERCGRVGYIYLSRLIALGAVDELRRMPEANPPDTRRLEVLCSDASKALAAIRRLPYIREATIFGRSIHILIDAGIPIDRLEQDVADCGDVRVNPTEASLEDVFVTLTKQSMQQEAAV